jgi:hypothetical protein
LERAEATEQGLTIKVGAPDVRNREIHSEDTLGDVVEFLEVPVIDEVNDDGKICEGNVVDVEVVSVAIRDVVEVVQGRQVAFPSTVADKVDAFLLVGRALETRGSAAECMQIRARAVVIQGRMLSGDTVQAQTRGAGWYRCRVVSVGTTTSNTGDDVPVVGRIIRVGRQDRGASPLVDRMSHIGVGHNDERVKISCIRSGDSRC